MWCRIKKITKLQLPTLRNSNSIIVNIHWSQELFAVNILLVLVFLGANNKTQSIIGESVDSRCPMLCCVGWGRCCRPPHGLRLGCPAVINRVKVINMLWITGGPGKHSTRLVCWRLIGCCLAQFEATPMPILEVIWRAKDLWPHPKKDDRKLWRGSHWPICEKMCEMCFDWPKNK